MNKRGLFGLVSLAFLSSFAPALSHPVVLPLPVSHSSRLLNSTHTTSALLALLGRKSSASSTLTSKALLSTLLKKGSSNYFFGTNFIGSGSSRALYSSLKLTSENSIVSSINLSNLTSGQFAATQYFSTAPNGILYNDGNTFRAFGSNPLNVSTVANVSIPNISTSFIQGKVTGTVLTGGASAFALPESAATRRIASLYESVAQKGAQIGSFISAHPTGGVLYGTFYTQSGNTLSPDAQIALAFGNSPLNTSNIGASNVPIPYVANGSYILFGSKIFRPVINGQFFGAEYIEKPNGTWTGNEQFLYVFGNNPLNSLTHASILYSAFKSYFYL